METITRGGRKFVLVPVDKWERLTELPPLPEADADGNVDAIEYARASIARTIISRRVEAGLSQAELARRARVRVETLNRIERAKVTADTATLSKIDRALNAEVSSQPIGRGGERAHAAGKARVLPSKKLDSKRRAG
jgi:ribosome-binding protein aMBF1 (putative translation factor)